jgi:predicted AlkP superfamily phosphohydrolase/phosphomutase
LLLLVLNGCGGAPPPAPRVIVLGIDGFSPDVLMSLLARQRLPTFAKLAREGSIGTVGTADTGLPSFSPRIWASFATGFLPEKHGVIGYMRHGDGDQSLFSSDDRLVPALWEIAALHRKRVGVVNWPTTYPAEPIDGFVISERYLPSTEKSPDERTRAQVTTVSVDRLVYPPELLPSLAALEITAASTPPGTPERAEEDDRQVLTLTWKALAEHPVDLLFVYTRAMDSMQHLTWNTHEPLPGEPTPPVDLVEDLAVRWDGILADVLRHLTPADHLIVLSDHGAERSLQRDRLPGKHESAAAAFGILLLWGPRVRNGSVTATTLDIAPTILELAGIPPTVEMPGRVLANVIAPGAAPLVRRKEPYVRAEHERTAPGAAGVVDESIREHLRALGYAQ